MIVASQVKGNADVIMILEQNQMALFLLINLFLKVLANPSELIKTKMGMASCSLFIKTYQQDLFLQKRQPLKAFLLSLICARRNGLYIFLTILTKTTYPHIWNSSDELWIFILSIMISLFFSRILMQMQTIIQCKKFNKATLLL